MVNSEHSSMLTESVETWNEWRRTNPTIVPALWGADLEGVDLSGADLTVSDLEEANLSRADLGAADLRDARLKGADLRGANLRSAYLGSADLKRVNLQEADLRGAAFLQAEQLCEAKTLYQAQLDPYIQNEAKQRCPHLFEEPKI